MIGDIVIPDAEHRAQPDRPQKSDDYRKIQQKLISTVGAICIGIPLMAYLVNTQSACFSDSISHFYYRALWGDIFVMALAVAGVLLIVFRSDTGIFDHAAFVAGLLLLIVALVPTGGSGCASGSQSMEARAFFAYDAAADCAEEAVCEEPVTAELEFEGFAPAFIHKAAAIAYLVLLFVLCTFGFTRITDEDKIGGKVVRAKRIRNAIYRLCGAFMAGAMLFYVASKLGLTSVEHPTFWVEFIALIAFGVAWLVKGRVFSQMLKSPREA
ncbi:hypothetical protein ACMA5I_11180 [Paracoccaceae bacterium GXU_MW_L88]